MFKPFETIQMANAVRFLAVDAVEKAQSGHPGMPLGMADVLTVLFSEFLRFHPQQPHWLNRDRFVLSNGHGSAALYALLHLCGYALTLDDLKNFRQLHSKTPGHPEVNTDTPDEATPGVETTTGPLAQGLANAVGMALAGKQCAARFGANVFNHKVYVALGDGCLMEGLSHEVCELAGHLQLNNLVLLVDDNRISIDGDTSLATSTSHKKRFEAYNFKVMSADGHTPKAIRAVLKRAQKSSRPVVIFFRTHIGYGTPVQDNAAAHGSPLGSEAVALLREKRHWPHPPFVVPDDVYALWQKVAANNIKHHTKWQKELSQTEKEADIHSFFQRDYTAATTLLQQVISLKGQEKTATRKASGLCVEALFKALPLQMMSGSADLSSSVFTHAAGMAPITAQQNMGSYIHYGVREHGMAAIMNGMALYGGFLPVGGTFLSFADYMRPAIRLSALMKQQVVYVLTHDSIGLGEDGPTHQPVEQLAMLRATPNLHVYRPADVAETACCWHSALQQRQTPSVLALSRQNLPAVSPTSIQQNLCALGAYTLAEASISPAQASSAIKQVLLLASGSEVHVALAVKALLEKQQVAATVVSVPCMELFDKQPEAYRNRVLPPHRVHRFAIEAGSSQSWYKYVGLQGHVFGINTFGASAPADDLFRFFELTAGDIAHKVQKLI